MFPPKRIVAKLAIFTGLMKVSEWTLVNSIEETES